MAFNNKIIVGDYENGNIYAFDLDTYADNGQIQKWLRSWRALPTGQNNLKRTAQHAMQIDMESGVGLNGYLVDETQYLITESGDYLITESDEYLITDDSIPATVGANPQIMLRWSDDGGHTWSNYRTTSVGKIGEYYYRVWFRRLGMTLKLRDRVYELSMTDPVKTAIMGAELLITPTNA